MVAIKLNGKAGFTISKRTGAATPARPTNLTPIGGDGTVKLFWTAVNGATSYDVQSSPDNVTWTTISAAQTPISFTDAAAPTTAATTGTAYYRIRANGATGSSSYCSSVSASPFLMYDLTTGTNGTVATAHTPDLHLGNAYEMVSADGAIQITSNKFVTKTNATSGILILAQETGQKDVTMTALIQSSDGIRARVVDASNSWMISIFSGHFSIYEYKAGVATQKADDNTVSITAGLDYLVSVTVIGNNIVATLNGAHQISATISSSYAGALTATKHGWSLNNTGAISKLSITAASPLPGMAMWLRGLAGATVSTWSDQSHNGADANQATGANQMSVQTNVLNGQTIMRGNAASIMNVSNIQPTNTSFVKVALFKSSNLAGANHLMSGSNADGAHAFRLNGSQFPESDIYASGSPVVHVMSSQGVGSPQTNWALAILNAWYSDPAASSHISPETLQEALYVNSVAGAFTKANAETMVSSATLSVGGLQGSTTLGFVGDIAELMLSTSSRGPSAADINRLIALVNSTYALSIPFFTKQVLYIGDSITAGYRATAGGGSWASTIAAANPTRWHLNKGQASAGLADMVTEASVQFSTLAGCGVSTSVVIFAGTNDIALYTKTGAQAFTSLLSLCSTLRTAGAAKIAVVTMLPRGAGSETERQNLNNAIRADGLAHFDAVADVETLSMGAAGANSNTTWYNVDGTHPNDLGHAQLANLISGVMSSIW
jgi:lysophospholipase L1-like esterase